MTVMLDDRHRSAVRRLLAAEPETGSLLPDTALRAIEQLVGCDSYGIGEHDEAGYVIRALTFPHQEPDDPKVCNGPLPTGLIHDAQRPGGALYAPELGLRDLIHYGFHTGRGTVVQLYFSRRRVMFNQRDVDVLTMVEPAVGRLVRGCAGRLPTGSLSASERRVLTLVARGATNREVAEELYVTVHTVRKHLENTYRKLGVTNRTAAALLIHAETRPPRH